MKRLIVRKKVSIRIASGGYPWVQITNERLDEGPEGWHNPTATTCRQDGTMATEYVASLPGMNNEHTRMVWTTQETPQGTFEYFGKYEKSKWNKLVESIKNEGIQHPILIEVDENGNASIVEGNHRAWAAKEAGVSSVPVEVRYKGNSQRQFKIGG